MNRKPESPFFIMIKIISWPFKSFFRIFVVVFIVGLYIYQAVTIDELARDIRILEVEHNKLLNQKERLSVEIEQLTNINRIQDLAREKFGLVNGGNQMENLVIKKYENEKIPDENEKVQLAGVN